MRLFCAYAFTGENLETVTQRMRLVVDTLNTSGHQAYCNRFDKVVDELLIKDDAKGIFQSAFGHIRDNDALVAVVSSPSRSIGQIMEIGVALSQKKPVYLFEHVSAANSSYLSRLAEKHFSWQTDEDLRIALQRI